MIDPTQETLGSVLHTHAIGQPDNVAMIGVNRSITWHELDQEVNRVARLFASLGVKAGDAVGMCTSKRPEVSITFIALSRLGAIAAPVNFKLEPGRIAQQFATAQIKAVLLEAKLDPIMAPLTEHFGDRVVYLDEDGSLGGVNYASISEISGEHLGSDAKPDDICYYNYTSGTTGQPKAAEATHANILWNSVRCRRSWDEQGRCLFGYVLCLFSPARAVQSGSRCWVCHGHRRHHEPTRSGSIGRQTQDHLDDGRALFL